MSRVRISKILFLIFTLTALLFSSNLAFPFEYKVYPVILVHGITGNFYGWIEDENVPGFLNPYYDCYADRNSRYKNYGWSPYSRLNLDYNVFGINYSKPNGSIEDNAIELDRAINGYNGQDGIRQIMSKAYAEIFPTPEDVKVVIIAHSMGGLSSRRYIQNYPSNHHVAKIITLGTPHQGSFAADKEFVQGIKGACWVQGAIFVGIGVGIMWIPDPTGWSQFWGSSFVAVGSFLIDKGFDIQHQIDSGLLDTDGSKEMIPVKSPSEISFLSQLNSPGSIPSNLDYRLVAGRGPWTESWFNTFLGLLGEETTDGDAFVSIKSALGKSGIRLNPIHVFQGINVLKDSPHYILTAAHNKPIVDEMKKEMGFFYEEIPTLFQAIQKNNFLIQILEDPPVISNVSLFTSDSKPLPNNAPQDINKPGIIITGNLWDYLLNKTNAQLSFSYQTNQNIDFDTFGYFSETATLAAGGKNTIFVSASNPANYYSSSSSFNIYLVGISSPRDGMVLTPEKSSEFQYSIEDTSGVITTEVQSLSFGDYGGVLPEKIIDLPTNARRLSQPQYISGELNPDITFLDENNNPLMLDESSRYIVEGKTKFKAKLNNAYEGRTFVKLQGNADASQWGGYNIEIGKGENPTIWDIKNFPEKVPGPSYGILHNWETTRLNGAYQTKCKVSGQEVNSATYYLGTKAPATGDTWTTIAYEPYRKMELWFPPEALKGKNYITISAMNRTATIQTPNPLFKPVGHIYEIKPGLTEDDFNSDTTGGKKKANFKFKYTYENINFDITGDSVADPELIKNNLGLYRIISGKPQLIYSENKPDSFILVAPINDFSDSFVVLPSNSPPQISQPYCSPFIFTPGKETRDTATVWDGKAKTKEEAFFYCFFFIFEYNLC